MSWSIDVDEHGRFRVTDAGTGKKVFDLGFIFGEWSVGGCEFLTLVQQVGELIQQGKTAAQIRDSLVRGAHVNETAVMLAWLAVKIGISMGPP